MTQTQKSLIFGKNFSKFLLAAALGLPLSAHAQVVSECDGWRASAQAIAEPWEASTRSFANGEVRITLMDTVEPGAVPFLLLVLSPPRDELGVPQCRLIGWTEGFGFAGVDFAALQAGYDAKTGLNLTVPVTIYLPDQDFTNSALLTVTVNQSTGQVAATAMLGGE